MTTSFAFGALAGAALALLGCSNQAAAPALAGVSEPGSSDVNDREAWAKGQGLVWKQFDLNRDGKPDVWKFYRQDDDPKNPGNKLEVLVRKDTDLNNDGKVDDIRFYDDKGRVKEERIDLDFDGRFDETLYFEEGKLVRKEIDLDYDGRVDVTKYYSDGKLVRVELDRNKDGRVDAWEYYENGTLDRIGLDNDFNGTADVWQKRKTGEGAAAVDSGEPGGASAADEAASGAPPAPAPTP